MYFHVILQRWPRETLTANLGSGIFLLAWHVEIQGESADSEGGDVVPWLGEVLEACGIKLTPGALLLLVSVPGS